jgi:outer membrane protein
MRPGLALALMLLAGRPARADYALTASTASVPLTLSDCVAKALADAVTVLKAGNLDSAAAAQLLQGYAQFLPNFDVLGTYGQQHGMIYYAQSQPTLVDQRSRGYGYQLSSTLNLFSGLSDYGAFKSALGSRRAAGLNLERARQQVALDIEQAYLQVKLDEEIVRFGEENLKASEERESLLDQQTQVGARGLPDLYRQQAQTSSDRSFLIDARNKRRDDLLALLRRARFDMGREYALADVDLSSASVGGPYEDESALLSDAAEERPDLHASFDLVEAARGAVASARSGYFPRVDLGWTMAATDRIFDTNNVTNVSGVGAPTDYNMVPPFQPSQASQLNDYVNYTVGLTLTWGIFDRLTTRAASKQAQAAADNALLDYQDAQLGVEEDVKQAYGDFHAAQQKLEAAQGGIKAARESYDATRQRYEVSASSLLDLLTAQSALLQAEAALAQAEIGLYLQGRQMEFALGRMPTVGADAKP